MNRSIIYQATMTTDSTTKTYIGHCDMTFNTRYSNHLSSLKHSKHRNSTELSKHVWNLKDQNTRYCITWHRLKQFSAYSNITKKCNLCLWENFFIICKLDMASLNKCNELLSTCRHARKFYYAQNASSFRH